MGQSLAIVGGPRRVWGARFASRGSRAPKEHHSAKAARPPPGGAKARVSQQPPRRRLPGLHGSNPVRGTGTQPVFLRVPPAPAWASPGENRLPLKASNTYKSRLKRQSSFSYPSTHAQPPCFLLRANPIIASVNTSIGNSIK